MNIPQWCFEHGEFLLELGQHFQSPQLRNTGLTHAEEHRGAIPEHWDWVEDLTLEQELALAHIAPDFISLEIASPYHHFP